MNKVFVKTNVYFLQLFIFVLILNGCVWVIRPPDTEVSAIPPPGEQFTTITVSRKDQFALSGVVFTILLDNLPIANLRPGQYTTFETSAGNHTLSVSWKIGGLGFIGPYGSYADPTVMHRKDIAIHCVKSESCFITIEAKAFARQEKDRVILNQVKYLEGDFSIQDKSYVPTESIKQH